MVGIRDYSTNADANLAVAGISLAEGWPRASVNNAYRAGMADIADLLLDIGGSKQTTGSGITYSLTLDTNPTAYANNLFFLATAHVGNADNATINVNGLGAKLIKKLVAGVTYNIVEGDFPFGHIGIFTYSSLYSGVILLNPAKVISSGGGIGLEFNTVADMLASEDEAKGEGALWQADGFRYREADPAATDHHLITAAGVKLYVQPGDDGWYNFRAMNPAADGVTNDADKLKRLLAIRPTGGITVSHPNSCMGPSIQIPMGVYFMDAGPWGFQVKATTHIRGQGYAPDNDARATVLLFPVDVVGFEFNHTLTFENQYPEPGGVNTGSAIGSTFERIILQSQSNLGTNPNAHGIFARTCVHVRDCTQSRP
jgi:hypothetical protein